MASGRCEACGQDEYMPYVCKFCKQKFCAAHRLPENHSCKGLDEFRSRVRAEGRLMAPEGDAPVRPSVSAAASWRAGLARAGSRLEGKMAMVFLGTMVASYVVQVITLAAAGRGAHDWIFVLDRNFLLHPWVLVTSIFAHGGVFHLLLNAMVLFFFGPSLEGLLGSRRFTLLFVGAGLLGGLGEIFLSQLLPAHLATGAGVLGASGAIMGLLGTLTILAPRLTILLFFVIPAPLWAVTALFALIDFARAFEGPSNVAHLAHLSGLVVGLLYGKHLHGRGLRAHVRSAQTEPWRPR